VRPVGRRHNLTDTTCNKFVIGIKSATIVR
jgi:hypothetical protein